MGVGLGVVDTRRFLPINLVQTKNPQTLASVAVSSQTDF